jgi:TolB-like protein
VDRFFCLFCARVPRRGALPGRLERSVKTNPSTNSSPLGHSTRVARDRERQKSRLTASWAPVEIEQIQQQLSCILESSIFAHSNRQTRFLRYIVQATLTGGADRLNQRIIGIEVFDRPDSFDPVVDSIVRVEAGRLRCKLREYYYELGKNDRVFIELPRGSYAVRIRHVPIDGGRRRKAHVSAGAPDAMAVAGMPQSLQGVPPIAVLPFHSISGDRDQEFFADGITDDLITDLARISGLSVVSRQSVFAYKGSVAKAQRISEELGVGLMLEGSIRRDGNRVRINVQLIDGSSGKHIWAKRYDRTMGDIFDLQDDVNRRVVQALRLRLSTIAHAPFEKKGGELSRAEHNEAGEGAKNRSHLDDELSLGSETTRV